LQRLGASPRTKRHGPRWDRTGGWGHGEFATWLQTRRDDADNSSLLTNLRANSVQTLLIIVIDRLSQTLGFSRFVDFRYGVYSLTFWWGILWRILP
jgi:hypothetical protein